MTAELVGVEVGSSEWHESRRQGVTASEIAGLLGIAPDSWTSPFNLYHQKVNGIGAEPDNEQMQWGHELEAVILRRFAREHPELGVTTGGLYRHSDRPWQMATPDGVAYDAGPWCYCEGVEQHVPGSMEWCDGLPLVAVVQIKTATKRDGWGEPGTDEIPPYYLAQVRYEMDVMGVDLAYVPVLFNVHDYREYVVHQDDQDAELMRKEAADFLARIERDDPPDVDYRAATLRTLKELHPKLEDEEQEIALDWVREYRAAQQAAAEAEKRKKEAEAHIRVELGDAAHGVVDGQRVVSRSVSTVKEHWRAAYDRDVLTVRKNKEQQA